MLHTIRLTW